ncbi:MAG: hypothetical protein Q8O84_01410 [Nanoarchaeota archaeon]|nr:hypothetical protein [Nanoarchaeota archaeon]
MEKKLTEKYGDIPQIYCGLRSYEEFFNVALGSSFVDLKEESIKIISKYGLKDLQREKFEKTVGRTLKAKKLVNHLEGLFGIEGNEFKEPNKLYRTMYGRKSNPQGLKAFSRNILIGFEREKWRYKTLLGFVENNINHAYKDPLIENYSDLNIEYIVEFNSDEIALGKLAYQCPSKDFFKCKYKESEEKKLIDIQNKIKRHEEKHIIDFIISGDLNDIAFRELSAAFYASNEIHNEIKRDISRGSQDYEKNFEGPCAAFFKDYFSNLKKFEEEIILTKKYRDFEIPLSFLIPQIMPLEDLLPVANSLVEYYKNLNKIVN